MVVPIRLCYTRESTIYKLKDKAQYNEYMRVYMKRMWDDRRKAAIDHLGGKCVHCGTSHGLEFDHIDPLTKSFTIASRPSAAVS